MTLAQLATLLAIHAAIHAAPADGAAAPNLPPPAAVGTIDDLQALVRLAG